MIEHIPTGLQHVLEVVRLVRADGMDRLAEVKAVAKKHRIDPQTVTSACTRSLGINTTQLDEILEVAAEPAFCANLVRRFPPYQDYIERFFAELRPGPSPN